MKKMTLAILLCLALLLPGCTPQTPPAAEPTPAPTPTPVPTPEPTLTPVTGPFEILTLEPTDWPVLTTDKETFGLTGPEGYDDMMRHFREIPLDQLVIFAMHGDGAYAETSHGELRARFLEAPHKVLSYLVLLEDQTVHHNGWPEPTKIAEDVCRFIAQEDVLYFDGSDAFAQTMAACREDYPSGPVAALLDVMETEHAAGMERRKDYPIVTPMPSP